MKKIGKVDALKAISVLSLQVKYSLNDCKHLAQALYSLGLTLDEQEQVFKELEFSLTNVVLQEDNE